MAKTIRSIKADLCDDETLGACTRDARYLFVGLITRVDDYGRFRANPALVRSRVYPYDDDVTNADVTRWLAELVARGRIQLYEHDGQAYGVIAKWDKHQRIDNAAKSEFPPPPTADDTTTDPPPQESAATRRNSPQPAADGGEPPPLAAGVEGIGEEGSGRATAAAAANRRGHPPKLPLPNPWPLTDALRAIAHTDGPPGIDVEREHARFVNHHKAKGTRLIDWEPEWANWCANGRAPTNGNGHKAPKAKRCPDCRQPLGANHTPTSCAYDARAFAEEHPP